MSLTALVSVLHLMKNFPTMPGVLFFALVLCAQNSCRHPVQQRYLVSTHQNLCCPLSSHHKLADAWLFPLPWAYASSTFGRKVCVEGWLLVENLLDLGRVWRRRCTRSLWRARRKGFEDRSARAGRGRWIGASGFRSTSTWVGLARRT